MYIHKPWGWYSFDLCLLVEDAPFFGSEVVELRCVDKNHFSISEQPLKIGNLLQKMESFYLRHFDPEIQGKKKSQGQALRTELSRFGAEVQKAAHQRSVIAHGDRNHHVLPPKRAIHLSSLNLLAPISFFFPFGLLLTCEEGSFVCPRCGLNRHGDAERQLASKTWNVDKQSNLPPTGGGKGGAGSGLRMRSYKPVRH